MDRTLLSKIWPVFVEEAREHLQQISAGVLELERSAANRPPGLLDSVRRTAHSLKGSAASLGLHDLEKLAHAVEGALAGKGASDQLEAGLVEAILGSVDTAESALSRGDAGGDPSIPELAEQLQRLAGAKPAASAPARERGPAEELWPVFRAEAGEHLQHLQQALADRKQGKKSDRWPKDEGEALEKLAATLRASASVLGLWEMERLAGQAEAALSEARAEGKMPAERLGRLEKALAQLESAVGASSAEPPQAPPAPAEARIPQMPGQLLAVFREEAQGALSALEQSVAQLVSPFVAERAQVVEDAVRRAHNLKGSAGAVGAGPVAALAAKVHQALPALAETGLDASRSAAAIAGFLVDLKAALSEWGAAPAAEAPAAAPAPASEPPGEKPEARQEGPAVVDRTIRVSVNTLESVGRQVEAMALVRARQERRSRELAAHTTATREILVLCERALSDLRLAGGGPSVAPMEDAVQRLRLMQRSLARLGQDSSREAEQLRLVSAVVREDLRDLRMVPASTALEPLRRTVRETAGRVGKQVELSIEGGDVRLDRRILDELKDPLLHMVRNSIDHGVEAPEARVAAGKRPSGMMVLRVERRGHRIAIIVGDDGGGIAADKVRATAQRRGLLTAQQALAMEDEEVLRLIFKPGFSTAEKVTAISGRGVGLDVVQETVTRLGGTVEVDSNLGKGTRFTLDLPLTLAATLAVVVKVGGELAAIPYESVERILRLSGTDLGTVAGRASVQVGEAQLPFTALTQVLGLPQARLTLEGTASQAAMLIDAGGQRVVFAVDEVVGQQEVVVHSLGKHVSKAPHLGGAAVLEDGQVVAVLNAFELVRLARPLARGRQADQDKVRILIADDSLTTRSAMKALLEIAGFQVLPASDGEEALKLLAETPVQLVVSDVQMPRMDGLALTRRIKGHERYSSLPVILVTSLDSAGDRAAGLEAGADGYLIKREVERGKLLELVKQLLPHRG